MGLLNSLLPALTTVQPADRLPFDSMESMGESDFAVLGSGLVKATLLVRPRSVEKLTVCLVSDLTPPKRPSHAPFAPCMFRKFLMMGDT